MQHPYLSDPPVRAPAAEEVAVARAWVARRAAALRRRTALWLPPVVGGLAFLLWSGVDGQVASQVWTASLALAVAWGVALYVAPGSAATTLETNQHLRAFDGVLWHDSRLGDRAAAAVWVPEHWPPLYGDVEALVFVPARRDGRPLHRSLSGPLVVRAVGTAPGYQSAYSIGQEVRDRRVRPQDVTFQWAGDP